MLRRTFSKLLLGTTALTALGVGLTGVVTENGPLRPTRRVRPGDPGWPSAADWAKLRQAVGGRLIDVTHPLDRCGHDPEGAKCQATLKNLENPFYIQDEPGATQTVGWVDAWTSKPSVHAVSAKSTADVVAAVNFARKKNLRLVVKGGGHSYLGQSNAPDSLLLWTKDLNKIEMAEGFVPKGGEGKDAPVHAVHVEAGAKFLGLYDLVTTQNKRYVQGGGCTSVGVGGHIQTGGFGSFSKAYGMTAGGLIEAELVTADGKVLTVNRHTHPDLYFAIRGGGCSFGVLTRMTLRTHALPERFGFFGKTVKASSDEAFKRVVEAFVTTAAPALITPHWGEQVHITGENELKIEMVFQGLSDEQALAVWAPFESWLQAHPDDVAEAPEPRIVSMPAYHWWDYVYRRDNLGKSIVVDDRPEAKPGTFWWAGNSSEVGIYLTGYDSVWLPESLLTGGGREDLTNALFAASRRATVSLHLNKGLAGASEQVKAESRELSVNPVAVDAFALAIVATAQEKRHPGLKGYEPDLEAARSDAEKVKSAMATLRAVAPEGGAYCSEASYFNADWRTASWGGNYERLRLVKEAVDPGGLFYGHHWVGSELWVDNGFTPVA